MYKEAYWRNVISKRKNKITENIFIWGLDQEIIQDSQMAIEMN